MDPDAEISELRRRRLREALSALMDSDGCGALDELGSVLLHVAGLVARIRRSVGDDPRSAADLSMLDLAFGRSITLTRDMREHLSARKRTSEFASMSRVAREVVGHLQVALPADTSLRVSCPNGPVVVAVGHTDIRRLLTALVGCAFDPLASGGVVEVDVSESAQTGAPSSACLEVRCPGVIDAEDSQLASIVRPLVNAIGGAFELRSAPGGQTAMNVRLPRAC